MQFNQKIILYILCLGVFSGVFAEGKSSSKKTSFIGSISRLLTGKEERKPSSSRLVCKRSQKNGMVSLNTECSDEDEVCIFFTEYMRDYCEKDKGKEYLVQYSCSGNSSKPVHRGRILCKKGCDSSGNLHQCN